MIQYVCGERHEGNIQYQWQRVEMPIYNPQRFGLDWSGQGFRNQQMVWCATDDSLEMWLIPKHVKLLAHTNYCFVSMPGGTQEYWPSHCSQWVWLDWHNFLSFSIILLGMLSEHHWEILLQLTADRWHTSSCYQVVMPKHISPWSGVLIDFCSASINRRIKRAWQKK